MQTHAALEATDCELESGTRLMALIVEIAQTACHRDLPPSPPLRSKCLVRDVIDYLRQHYSHQVTLQELSTHMHTNPFVLTRQFRREIGMTPHDYLLTLRIAQAKRFILEGFSLVHVAQACGFSDQSHLTRQFKRKVGVTPGHFFALR